MARFKAEYPDDLLRAYEDLDDNSRQMLGEMCEAGAEVVHKLVLSNLKRSFKTTASLEKGLKVTKVYNTPSDGGVNVYVGFYGYNDAGPTTIRAKKKYSYTREGVPIPLIAIAREYGTSSGEAKKPFFRKAFRKSEIEAAMEKVQEKYLPKGD